MRWRVVALITIAVLLGACEYTEILIIEPDGTAVVRIEIDSDRDESSDTNSYGVQWSTMQERSTEFGALDDDQFHLSVEFALPSGLVDGPDGWDLLLLDAASIVGPDDGTFSLSTDARANAAAFLSDLNATQGDPFVAQDADSDSGSEFGVPREVVIWVVATIAVFGLGVLAATFGLFEAGRVRRRDRRHLG